MQLEEWLEENADRVEWQDFAAPWDAMQRRHNPFRDDQIDTIIHLSGILDHESPVVLDLGCGPGTLGRRILRLKPDAQYHGLDADPLMLAAARHLLPRKNAQLLSHDLRSPHWVAQNQNAYEAIVSLTALHWLSQEHLRGLYVAALSALKPGGSFVVGDPYLPHNTVDRRRLAAFQAERVAQGNEPTWSMYWESLFRKYPIKDAYAEYHRSAGYQEPFEGSDDGYPLSFYVDSLHDAGFSGASVCWMSGLRAVYAGRKAEPLGSRDPR